MASKMPRFTIAAFVVALVSGMFYVVTVILQPILEDTLANTLQVVEAGAGLLLIISGIAKWVLEILKEPILPVGVKEFDTIFPQISDAQPEMLRDFPRLVDFKKNYIVKPPETYGKLIERLWIAEGKIKSEDLSNEQTNSKFHIGILSGPSGCGKTVTSMKLAFDLKQKKWKVYYCEAPALFSHNEVADIKKWVHSLTGKKLIIIDNTHQNDVQTELFLSILDYPAGFSTLFRLTRIRILCIHTNVHVESRTGLKHTKHTIGGKQMILSPVKDVEGIGLTGLPILPGNQSGIILGKYPTLQITEGREIAETIYNRFYGVERVEKKLEFEEIFQETGTVVELCEVLRKIKYQSIEENEYSAQPWRDIPRYALRWRLKDITNKRLGTLILGLVSIFSNVGSAVDEHFIGKILEENINQTKNDLAREKHIISRIIGDSMHEYLIGAHPTVASILKEATFLVLGDFFGFDDVAELELKLFGDYLNYLRTMPKTTSKIGSSFLLTLSSYSADREVERFIGFVEEKSKKYPKQDANIAMSIFNLGVYYLKKNELNETEKLFLQALDILPDSVYIRVNLGAVYYFKNELQRARDILEYIPEENRNASVLSNLGIVLHEMGESESGLKMVKSATEIQPWDARYWHHLGKIEMDIGASEKARVHLLKAISIDPSNGAFYATVSKLLLDEGHIREAENLLRESLDSGITRPANLINLGVAYKLQGQIDLAREMFMRSLEIDPSNALAHTNLSDIFLREGDIEKAEKHITTALELDPSLAPAHAFLGQIQQRRLEFNDAKREYEVAISNGFENYEVLINLSFVYYQLEEMSSFKEMVGRATEFTGNAAIVFLDISLYLKQDDESKSREYCQKAINLMNQYIADKKFKLAEAVLDKLSLIHPNQYEVWANLGTMRSLLGRYEDALVALEEAVGIEKKDPGLWHNLGNVYKELDMGEKAEEAYSKARDLRRETDSYEADFSPEKGWNTTD